MAPAEELMKRFIIISLVESTLFVTKMSGHIRDFCGLYPGLDVLLTFYIKVYNL